MVWDYAEANVLPATATGGDFGRCVGSDGSLDKVECLARYWASARQIRRLRRRMSPRTSCLHRPTLLRQHRLRRPVRFLLCLAAPLTAVGLPRPVRHAGRAQSRGIRRRRPTGMANKKSPQKPFSRRHDPGDAASRRAGAPSFPVTIYYAFKQSEKKGDWALPVPVGRPSWMP